MPKKLQAFTASSDVPQPLSKMACASVTEASTPLFLISATASGAIFVINSAALI